MNSADISNRDDIYRLVFTFYDKIKKDALLGPIFKGVIPEDQWEAHLQKLTDFWQTNLFFVRKFKGNPMKAHKDVDKKFDYSMSQDHFNRWLFLWDTTVDDLFSGTKANDAKSRARNIAGVLLMKIMQTKPTVIPR